MDASSIFVAAQQRYLATSTMLRRERTVVTTLRLPESVYLELRLLCVDPAARNTGRTGRAIRGPAVKYDTWSALFTHLARQHLDAVKVARVAADEDTTE